MAKVMGHEQTSTTLDRYMYATRDRDDRVLAAVAAYALPPAPSIAEGPDQDPPEMGVELG